MNPKIYSTAVWVTNRKVEISVLKKHLTFTKELESYFKSIYEIAYKLFYNKFFIKQVKYSYLGFEKETHPQIGDIRLDYVYVENNFLELDSLHVHINFITANKNFIFDGSSNHELNEIVKFLAEFRSSDKNPSEPFKCYHLTKGLFLDKYSNRKYTYPLSKYLFTSICNLNNEQIKNWESLAIDIWKPLYLHIKGVDEGTAIKILKEANWKSTDFFINFFQPGALISISTIFPLEKNIYKNNLDWFSGDQVIRTNNPKFKLPDRNGWDGEDYDLLPEYPPLKYLGLLPLELSGSVEENLRHLYDGLLCIQQNPYPVRIWKSVFKFPSLETRYFKTNHQEFLKLPITREYASKMRDNKVQESIYNNLKELKTSMLNGIMLFLTILAIFIAIMNLVPLLGDYFNGVDTNTKPKTEILKTVVDKTPNNSK